jgi:hypothetical protein
MPKRFELGRRLLQVTIAALLLLIGMSVQRADAGTEISTCQGAGCYSGPSICIFVRYGITYVCPIPGGPG